MTSAGSAWCRKAPGTVCQVVQGKATDQRYPLSLRRLRYYVLRRVNTGLLRLCAVSVECINLSSPTARNAVLSKVVLLGSEPSTLGGMLPTKPSLLAGRAHRATSSERSSHNVVSQLSDIRVWDPTYRRPRLGAEGGGSGWCSFAVG